MGDVGLGRWSGQLEGLRVDRRGAGSGAASSPGVGAREKVGEMDERQAAAGAGRTLQQ
jgi:hypothetical protein